MHLVVVKAGARVDVLVVCSGETMAGVMVDVKVDLTVAYSVDSKVYLRDKNRVAVREH